MKKDIYDSSKRLKNVAFSPVREVSGRVRELESQGKDIVHFQIGEPDFDTPKEIIDSTIEALKVDKLTHYAPNRGYYGLRKSICDDLLERNNIKVDPDEEIIITVGAAEAIFDAIMGTINEGDEVIIFTPAFMNYKNVVNMAGGIPVNVPLREDNGFQVDIDDLKSKITAKTKMIILNNPNNPTGAVYEESIIREIGNIALKNDILIVTDEIYDEILYDNTKTFSLASLEEVKNNVITISGFSKAYAMTGWRVGYIVANKELISSILKVHQYVATCIPTFIQAGLAEGMLSEGCKNAKLSMVEVFDKRRNIVIDMLKDVESISFVIPNAAFYLFINVSKLGLSGQEFASRLLEEKGVAVVQGVAFGSEFTDYVRMSYATSEEEIIKGLTRIKEFCSEII